MGGNRQTEKGEVQDRLDLYTDDVMKNQSVSGGADEDVHKEILRIFDKALEATRKILKGVKCANSVPLKYALQEHVHEIRSLGKELCGRFRSLRYFKWLMTTIVPLSLSSSNT